MDFSFIRAVLQIAQKCFTQHFAGKLASAISMRGSAVRIIPRPITPVDQTLSRLVPAFQFHHRVKPTTQVPTTNARIQVADLLLTGSPDLFDVVKVLFDTPAVRNDLQDRLNTHRYIAAGVCRPVATSVFQNNHSDVSTESVAGGNKSLVTTIGRPASAGIRNRHPAVTSSGSLLQADAIFPIPTRPTALARLHCRNIEQFRIAAESGHDARTFGKQRTDKRPVAVRAGIELPEDQAHQWRHQRRGVST